MAQVCSVPDPREVGREVDRDIPIFGLDFSALDPVVGVAKICRGKETSSVKFVCVYLTDSIKGYKRQ